MTGGEKRIGRRFSVTGRVQGVGFRDYVQRKAQSLEIYGTVSNRPDGTVEVCAAGCPKAIAEMEGALRRGAPASNVETVKVEEWSGIENLREFRVLS